MSTISVERLEARRGEEYVELSALAAELARQQETKKDYIVDTRAMTFSTEDGTSSLTFDHSLAFEEETITTLVTGPIGERAHQQIGEHVGIPRKYYARMREDAPGLLDRNVGHWFARDESQRMVRMLDGNVRGFLSNGYKRRDNYDLMEQAVLPALQDIGGLRFHVAALTDERMTIRALLPNLQREVRVGDVVQAGVQIRNSEVGSAALDISPFLWRLSCLNGMVVPANRFRAIHLGRRIDVGDIDFYRDDTLAADDRAFFLKARDAIGHCFTEVAFEQIVAQLAAPSEPVANPVAATRELGATIGLSEEEGGGLLKFLAEGGDLTRWGAANAVTALAKTAPTFERQQELETAGWTVATLPDKEWARVAVAS